MARKTKGERVALYEGLLRATRDFADIKIRVAGAKDTTAAQTAVLLEGYLSAVQCTRTAEAALADAIIAERQALELAHATVEQFKQAVRARFGPESPRLSRYGIRPASPKRRSAESVMRAVQKARLTREARGTKSVRRLRSKRA